MEPAAGRAACVGAALGPNPVVAMLCAAFVESPRPPIGEFPNEFPKFDALKGPRIQQNCCG